MSLGICTEMLPAIVLSVASNCNDILRMAPEMLLLSLRLGLAASRRARNIEPRSGSWAMVIQGISKSQALEYLDLYSEANVGTFKGYLSNYIINILYRTCLFIGEPISAPLQNRPLHCGPPTLLQQLYLNPEALPGSRKAFLPISGPFHAQNVASPDLDEILGCSPIWDNRIPREVLIMSTATGEFLKECYTIRDLLRTALVEILRLPINLISVRDRLKGYLKGRKFSLVTLGPHGIDRYLEKALAFPSTGEMKPSLSLRASSCTMIDAETDSIAIIAVSGRFPGADSVEAFWDLLQHGVREVCHVVHLHFRVTQRLILGPSISLWCKVAL